MSRIQLALNVTDLESSIRFYSTMFRTEPAKRRPGYANFVVADPPLKLVLIEGDSDGGSLNHLGVEVFSTEEVGEAATRLAASGLETEIESQTTCCYAVQDKVWVHGPDDEPWEYYTVLDDAATMTSATTDGDACCAPIAPGASPAQEQGVVLSARPPACC